MERLIHLIRKEIRAETPYSEGSKHKACKLNLNESPFDLPEDLKSEILSQFRDIPFNRYPTTQPFRLMESLAVYHEHPADGILVGNGSNDLAQTLAQCLVGAGTRVVLPRPMFALYESVVRMQGGDIRPIPPKANLQFDMHAVIEAASDKEVALTIVATPNNPTGLSVPIREIRRLCDSAPGFVVIDEAYNEFNSEPSALSLLDERPNLIVLRTLSKAFGLAGLRIGYLLGNPSIMAEFLKARIPFMIDSLAETAAIALINRPKLVEERVRAIKSELQQLTHDLRELPGVTVEPTTTNFVLIKTPVPVIDLQERLQKSGVETKAMGYPELRGYLRVSSGTKAENSVFFNSLKRIILESD